MNHPGLFHCPLEEAYKLMPELTSVLDEAPTEEDESYICDVKVHMLMPGQYPCIPGWHRDMIPRDENKVPQPQLMDLSKEMMLWLSGPPLTEFRFPEGDILSVKPRRWVRFTQKDEHRGVASKIHTWRTFIRLVPEPLLEPAPVDQWIRRHTQVYLNAEDYSW